MRATNILWIIDEDDVSLPTEMTIPEDVAEEEIEDYLTDAMGFCHDGYVLED